MRESNHKSHFCSRIPSLFFMWILFLLVSPTQLSWSKETVKVELSQEEQAWIAKNPTFQVGAYPLIPYITEVDGQVTGYMTDVLKAIARQVGLEPRFHFTNLSETLNQIQQGRFDVTMALIHTEEREKTLYLSQDSFPISLHIFTRNSRNDITSLESLSGKILASYEGYALNGLIKKFLPDTRILTDPPDAEGMFRLVAEGKADAAVQELHTGESLIRRYLISNVQSKAIAVFGGKITYQAHYYGTGKHSPILASILDKSHRMMPVVEKQRIWNNWFGKEKKAADKPLLNHEERAYLDSTSFRRQLVDGWMPFNFKDKDGKIIGLGEDYWALIREKLGLNETAGSPPVPFAKVLEGMREGQIDIHPNTTRTRSRETYAAFSKSYVEFPIAIANLKGAEHIFTPSALEGKVIAVGRNYSAYHLLKARYPDIKFLQVTNTKDALQRVMNGEANAAVDILPVLLFHMDRHAFEKIKIAGVTDIPFQVQVMVRKEHARLVPLINLAIDSITSMEHRAIQQKWMTHDIITTQDYRLLWSVIAGALLVITLVLLWNRSMAREIAHRKRIEQELVKAQQDAEAASQAKSQFLANMSHEIRTPLGAIIGFNEILLKQGGKLSLPESFQKYQKNIETSSQLLLELINNVLDLSKIEAGEILVSEEDFSIKELSQGIVDTYSIKTNQKNLHFTYEVSSKLPPVICSDRTKILQILTNLIGNAIKFTPAGKEIELKVTGDERIITFMVIDKGVGIPEDRKKSIFESFQQVDKSTTRIYGGTGLGLAITKNLIEVLGGKISVISQIGQGTTFSVSIPYKKASLLNVKHEEVSLKDQNFAQDCFVLVVEDDLMNHELIEALFEDLEFEIQFAENGKMGVDLVLQLSKEGRIPDLIFMDMQMPIMDGLEATRQIRSHSEFQNIPIIALSADAFTDQQKKADSVGINEYLTKPIEMDKLIPILKRYLSHKEK